MSDAWAHTSYPQQVHFGTGAVNRVAQVVRDTGARSWMLVMSAGRHDSDDGQRLIGLLGRSLTSTFTGATVPVSAGAVEGAVRQARRDGIEGVVSFGGGSCADLAKAVCFFIEQQAGTPGVGPLDRPVVPHVAVPTTYAGTAVLPRFTMTDTLTRRSREAGSPTSSPVAVLCDPDVVVTVPARLAAATGMSAMALAVEACCAPQATPEAAAVARAAVAAAAEALPSVADDPADPDARAGLLAAAVMAGRALLNAPPGLHHALSLLVAARTGAPHSLVAAVLLAHVLRFNEDAVPGQLHQVGAALGDPDDPTGAAARLVERLGLPTTLAGCGVDGAELDTVAALAAGDPALRTNPRPVGEADARAILEDAY